MRPLLRKVFSTFLRWGRDRSRVPVEGDFAKSRDELAERQ